MNNLETYQKPSQNQENPIKTQIEKINLNLPKEVFDINKNKEILPILKDLQKLQEEFEKIKTNLGTKQVKFADLSKQLLSTQSQIQTLETNKTGLEKARTASGDGKTGIQINNLTDQIGKLKDNEKKIAIELKGIDGNAGLQKEITDLESQLEKNNDDTINKIDLYKTRVLEISQKAIEDYSKKIENQVNTVIIPKITAIGNKINSDIGMIESNQSKIDVKNSTNTSKTTKENNEILKLDSQNNATLIGIQKQYQEYIANSYAGQLARNNIYQFQSDVRKDINEKYGNVYSNILQSKEFFQKRKDFFIGNEIYFREENSDKKSKHEGISGLKRSTRLTLANESFENSKIYDGKLKGYEAKTKKILETKSEIQKVYDIAITGYTIAEQDFNYQLERGEFGYYEFIYNYYAARATKISSAIDKNTITSSKNNQSSADLDKQEKDLENKRKENQITKEQYNKQLIELEKTREGGTEENNANTYSNATLQGDLNKFILLRNSANTEKKSHSKQLEKEEAKLSTGLELKSLKVEVLGINTNTIKDPISNEKQNYENIYLEIKKLKTYTPGEKTPEIVPEEKQ